MTRGPKPPPTEPPKRGEPPIAPDPARFESIGEPPAPVRPLHQRVDSWAWLLPAAGALLLASPLIRAFAVDVRLFGAPIIMVYIFVVWLILIGGAVALTRIDAAGDDADPPSNGARDGDAAGDPVASDRTAP